MQPTTPTLLSSQKEGNDGDSRTQIFLHSLMTSARESFKKGLLQSKNIIPRCCGYRQGHVHCTGQQHFALCAVHNSSVDNSHRGSSQEDRARPSLPCTQEQCPDAWRALPNTSENIRRWQTCDELSKLKQAQAVCWICNNNSISLLYIKLYIKLYIPVCAGFYNVAQYKGGGGGDINRLSREKPWGFVLRKLPGLWIWCVYTLRYSAFFVYSRTARAMDYQLARYVEQENKLKANYKLTQFCKNC